MGVLTTEIDTIEYQQTENIETEVRANDRIRAHRCTQHHPGCPSGASPSHNIIYYSTPADRSPSKKETPRWTVLHRITRQLLHLSDAGVLVRKFRQANPAQLS
jgi:hypothetical protein